MPSLFLSHSLLTRRNARFRVHVHLVSVRFVFLDGVQFEQTHSVILLLFDVIIYIDYTVSKTSISDVGLSHSCSKH